MPPGTGMCLSEYLEQPPNQLTCNPYINKELKLECTVSLLQRETLTGRLTVDWYRRPLLLNDTTTSNQNRLSISRINPSQNITIQEQMLVSESMSRVRSRLEIRELDASDVGQYWCGIRIDSTEWMILSDSVPLQDPSEYTGLDPCSVSVAQSKRERKCATWKFEPLPSPPSPVSTGQGIETTETTNSVSDSNGSTRSTASSTAATSSSTVATSSSNITTPSSTSLPEKENSDPQMEFYIAVGIVAALGTTITALVSLMICMCIKYKRMSRST